MMLYLPWNSGWLVAVFEEMRNTRWGEFREDYNELLLENIEFENMLKRV